MPELPEVKTTVRGLKQVLGREIEDVWCDNEKMTKQDYPDFKKQIKGKEIKDARRRAKFILMDLSEDKTLMLHQRLTGHLLLGKWERKNGEWVAEQDILNQKVNGYLHLIFYLDDGQMLVLSDLRKFATAELWDTKKLEKSDRLQKLGPEPLTEDFDLQAFKDALKRRSAAIKTILMKQEVLAGIGNIYSDEILWRAKIHPSTPTNELNNEELKKILKEIKSVLEKALQKRGTSIADYRDIHGEKGHYQEELEAYHQHGEPCSRCGSTVKRMKIGGRSAHFCPKCQPE
ncbi:MAG: bifunctional DNA-formamidopyrimidine glycosylase/DNA-(apurinic or apyrimidinic site) lyase [Candidatus Paceibacterota bacterium]